MTGCKGDLSKKSSVITEVYEVDNGADNTYAKGILKYMEHENFMDKVKKEKTFYNADQTIKGKEIYDYKGNSKLPYGSKFYDKNGALLSTYIYKYHDTLKISAHAYESDTETLLRVEGFKYDNKGNMVIKTIYDARKIKQKSFMFGHDKYGNEVKMVMTDGDDKQILSETYEIVTVDDKGNWLEKYGYLNDSKTPVTFYNKRKSGF